MQYLASSKKIDQNVVAEFENREKNSLKEKYPKDDTGRNQKIPLGEME